MIQGVRLQNISTLKWIPLCWIWHTLTSNTCLNIPMFLSWSKNRADPATRRAPTYFREQRFSLKGFGLFLCVCVLLDELLVVIIKTSHKDFLQYLTCCVCVLVCTCVCTCLSILHLWSHTVMQTLPGFLSTAWSFRRCCRCLCSLLCFVQVRLWQKRVWMCADICNSDLWWMDLCCVGLWLNLMVKLIKARQQLCNRTVHSELTAHNFHQVITPGNEF